MVERATAVPDDLGPSGEGWSVLSDALGNGGDVLEGLVFTESEGAEAVVVVDGPFLSAGLGTGGKDAPGSLFKVFRIPGGVDPGAVESAVVVVSEGGDPDVWVRMLLPFMVLGRGVWPLAG